MHWAVQQLLLTNKEIDAQDGYWSAVPLQFCCKCYERSDVCYAFVTGPCASGMLSLFWLYCTFFPFALLIILIYIHCSSWLAVLLSVQWPLLVCMLCWAVHYLVQCQVTTYTYLVWCLTKRLWIHLRRVKCHGTTRITLFISFLFLSFSFIFSFLLFHSKDRHRHRAYP